MLPRPRTTLAGWPPCLLPRSWAGQHQEGDLRHEQLRLWAPQLVEAGGGSQTKPGWQCVAGWQPRKRVQGDSRHGGEEPAGRAVRRQVRVLQRVCRRVGWGGGGGGGGNRVVQEGDREAARHLPSLPEEWRLDEQPSQDLVKYCQTEKKTFLSILLAPCFVQNSYSWMNFNETTKVVKETRQGKTKLKTKFIIFFVARCRAQVVGGRQASLSLSWPSKLHRSALLRESLAANIL